MLRVNVHHDAGASPSAPEELHRQSSISALMELRHHGKPTPPLEPTASFLGSLSNEAAPSKKGKRRTPACERAQKPKAAKETRASRTSKAAQPQPLLLSESFCAELSTSKSFCAELCTSLGSPRAEVNLMPPPLSRPCSLLGTFNLMPPLSRPGSFASSFGLSSSSFGSSFTVSSSAGFPSTPPSLYTYLSPVVSSTNLLSPTASKALEKGLGGGSTHDTYGSPLGGSPPAANESEQSEQPAALMLSESFFRVLDKPSECATAQIPTHTRASPPGCTPTSAQALEKDLWACTSFAAPMAHRQITPQKSLDGTDTPTQRRKKPLPMATAVPVPWTYYAQAAVPATLNRLSATDLMGQLGNTDLMGQRAQFSPGLAQMRPADLAAGVREVGVREVVVGGAAPQQPSPNGASKVQIQEMVAIWQASLQALLSRGDLAENNHRLLDPVAKCADPA